MPDVVVDARVLLALVWKESHADTVGRLLGGWAEDGAVLHAPDLARYEIASALTKSRMRGDLTDQDVTEALSIIDALGVIRPTTRRTWRSPNSFRASCGPSTDPSPGTPAAAIGCD